MLRVIVIGSQGQLARSLAEAAGGAPDLSLICLGRPVLDMSNAAALDAALAKHPADLVVNAAAYTAVDRAEAEPNAAFAVNRDGAAALAAACARRDLPLIHVSTDYVFDGAASAPYREDAPCNPQSVYGRSKYEGEQAVLAACRRAVVLRTAWLHSPFGSNFVATMLRLSRERDRLRVVADQHGSPTYAPELAAAILAMARRIQAAGNAEPGLFGIFHLAGAGAATWCDFAREIMAAAAVHGCRPVPVEAITTADYTTAARRPAYAVLDTGKIAAAYGIRLPPWHDGAARCVARLLAATP